MRAKVLVALAAATIIIGIYLSLSSIKNGIGRWNLTKLEKIHPASCVEQNQSIQSISTCLNKIGIAYSILGDTIDGDFRILISKPYAEYFMNIENWKVRGEGVGIRDTWINDECYTHLDTKIPTLSEKTKETANKYVHKWFEANPEAISRYIENIVETDSEVIISSLPLENIRNYTQYCPDYIVFHYLDDRPNTDLDETVLKKKP
jgi:hypothetical protein